MCIRDSNYTGSITKEATCTEAGVRSYTCSCGDSYTENIPATGHSLSLIHILSALSVSAKTDESETGKTTIVSFEELSKDITEQALPIGALESDIKFPTSLTVTVEKTCLLYTSRCV